jgi:hypothetical protein
MQPLPSDEAVDGVVVGVEDVLAQNVERDVLLLARIADLDHAAPAVGRHPVSHPLVEANKMLATEAAELGECGKPVARDLLKIGVDRRRAALHPAFSS